MTFSISNALLDSFLPAEKAEIVAVLEPVPLPSGSPLFEAGERPRYVHFLTAGMASIVSPMSDGSSVEVGVVGREGMPEALHLLGPGYGQTRCYMQVPGSGFRMSFKDFQERFFHNRTARLVMRYAQYQSNLLSQIAACNRLHEAEERLARWLLMVQDRIGSSDLTLTQEFLGIMLGSRRSTVTLMAGALQRSGFITYHRGRIKILDTESLENVTCECYAITKKLLVKLSEDL